MKESSRVDCVLAPLDNGCLLSSWPVSALYCSMASKVQPRNDLQGLLGGTRKVGNGWH